ncbi:bifunctional 4-hydroxy-2-oxoglutarate aldolase/2-dehydro-3-deoxy-phosphogluconate aldolase [Jeotgalibacillus haloalkalitolerans]|uniref:Bifunctional 4-hydroxy-2-oxoglutarate aldolase/2-dehydro-3-deoxy-phosphogluconate aldolase n=1 Tax=Jeotgalibacillus haloalkalitolerans TaxID=3104292 RepID=A0ABU5KJ96_9BACL|nr:bifunctional 4-hydroxy-2-oxoglutarate aldolase/2-dehydro-3-deoxy-phosphogluconate aldolase [Jeotgalibacillus sp. HH7-29]MDZ5711335.1 bifunctional 4-hydroxy-2-oxoglutarate aldolase/2-dehydro-3-deoxy-phosphogluconate aldolase [Jeotgalibacillus sp. HH7-29]
MNTALTSILDSKMVPIVRGQSPEDVLQIAKALYEGGVQVIEITLNSPGALKSIEYVSKELGDVMAVGAGTVLDPESARAALLAGASFILSPSVNTETIKMTKRYGAVSIPGAMTPTEIVTAFESGCDIVKVFPVTTLGPDYIKDIKGPLGHIPLMPTGGVSLDNFEAYLKTGAVACGLGSSLVQYTAEIDQPYLTNLTEKARRFTLIADQFKGGITK